jgi:LacI family transcriptional regulator
MASSRSVNRRVTLADVARRAGVSSSTASRALNGVGELAPETRGSVLRAALELGFQPSPLARSLRTRTTYTAGFVVPDISSPFYAGVLKGAQLTLEEAGYRVLLMDSERDREVELAALETLLTHQVDGILLSTTGLTAERFEEAVGASDPPCVLFDGVLYGVGAGCITLDNRGGMEALVEHLAENGHSRIAVLAGALAESSAIERLEGFRCAMGRRGLEVPEGFERVCDWTQASGRAAGVELLRDSPRPTAVVATSDDLALGCLAACREQGVVVPEELSLVSFDDPYFGELLEPPLTALSYQPREIGRIAASALIEQMRSPDVPRREVRVPVTLIVRGSSGRAPGAGGAGEAGRKVSGSGR